MFYISSGKWAYLGKLEPKTKIQKNKKKIQKVLNFEF